MKTDHEIRNIHDIIAAGMGIPATVLPKHQPFPTIDETLIDVGVDPRTPVDRLPEHAQWALAMTHYWPWETGEES